MSLYRIETAYSGRFEGGKFLGFVEAVDFVDALDVWACEQIGEEYPSDAWPKLGYTADDIMAYELEDEEQAA